MPRKEKPVGQELSQPPLRIPRGPFGKREPRIWVLATGPGASRARRAHVMSPFAGMMVLEGPFPAVTQLTRRSACLRRSGLCQTASERRAPSGISSRCSRRWRQAGAAVPELH